MKRSAGDPILVLKRSHAFYLIPRFGRATHTYTWYVHWLRLYLGMYKQPNLR